MDLSDVVLKYIFFNVFVYIFIYFYLFIDWGSFIRRRNKVVYERFVIKIYNENFIL